MNKTDSAVSLIATVYGLHGPEGFVSSCLSQSFSDIEIICVDMNASPEAKDFMKQAAESDARVKVIDSGGMHRADALNEALSEASGEYVVFCTENTFFPEDSIGKMYRTAKRTCSDMVVGTAEGRYLDETFVMRDSQRLSMKLAIEPSDIRFLGDMSLSDKIFRRGFLTDNGIRFENFSHAPDFVFTLSALSKSPKIHGLGSLSCVTERLYFLDSRSIRITYGESRIKETFRTHDRLIKEAKEIVKNAEDIDDRREARYFERLYILLTEKGLLPLYRYIWGADADYTDLIEERLISYRTNISDEEWDSLCARQSDIDIRHSLSSAEVLAHKPLVSVAITPMLSEKEALLSAASLFAQNFQRFELILPQNLTEKDSFSEIASRKNVKSLKDGSFSSDAEFKEQAVRSASGEFVMIIDEPLCLGPDTLSVLWKKLSKSKELDFAAALVKRREEPGYIDIPRISAAFGYGYYGKRVQSKINSGDVFLGNKLIRKRSIASSDEFEFGDFPAADSESLYKLFSFDKIRSGVMVTSMTEADLDALDGRTMRIVRYTAGSSLNRGVDKVKNLVKRFVTREDLERFGGRIKPKRRGRRG
ncbi:MAG: glycosyltransferase family 2 protein [Eubacterium sp.]|jgi:glycosyltransferase involved in cell wall biosynthesis